MKKRIGIVGFALIALIMFFSTAQANGQPNTNLKEAESCSAAYTRCDGENPTSWPGFQRCMFWAAC